MFAMIIYLLASVIYALFFCLLYRRDASSGTLLFFFRVRIVKLGGLESGTNTGYTKFTNDFIGNMYVLFIR